MGVTATGLEWPLEEDTLRFGPARGVSNVLTAERARVRQGALLCVVMHAVPIVDSGVAAYLNKTVQAARLKGARTIVTGISESVAETIVDLGIDWSGIETVADLQTGLRTVLQTCTGRNRNVW